MAENVEGDFLLGSLDVSIVKRILLLFYIDAIESKTVQVGYRCRCNLGTDGLILGISQ